MFILKKKISVTALLLAVALCTFAQKGTDSVKPFTGSKMFRKFSVGINVGALMPWNAIGGNNDFSKGKVDLGYGINAKYQVNHWVAIQGDLLMGKLKGDQSKNLGNGAPATFRAVSSYETKLKLAADLGAVITFGNVNWLSPTNMVVPYLHLAGGIASYNTDIINKGSTTSVPYVAQVPVHEFYGLIGAGLKVNVSNNINLDFGYRMNWLDGDNFDGFNYNPISKDKFSYAFAGIEFSFGKKSKPQLMFHNPAHSMQKDLEKQIADTKLMMNLKDTDGDGVADIFDKEPNTPPNCPVDTHGVTKDTDGDGVPDCKDKQLITPTECQPVDADGVGKCPEPACCSKITTPQPVEVVKTCTIGDLPSIAFKGNSSALSTSAKAMLATVAAQLKASETCAVTLTNYPSASKASQALCQKRLAEIKKYLIEKEAISADRITTNCEVGAGDANTVDITSSNL